MPISIAITTTDARITDANGDNGYGSVRIRPNESYQYDDGVDVIQVTKATVEILIADGQLQSALNLTPNEGASNVPETYYVVDIDVNNTRRREYWVLQNTPTSLEWGEVTRVPGPYSVASSSISVHESEENPHDQYVRFADLIDAGTIGTVSDGGGGIPRVDPVTGKLAASFMPTLYDAFPVGTKLLFSGTLPTGWTQDDTSSLNGAMLVGTTGVASSGGSVDPKTMAHIHTSPAHGHPGSTLPNHGHPITNLSSVNTDLTLGGGAYELLRQSAGNDTDYGFSGGSASVTIATAAATINSTSISPKYYEVMIGVKA